MNLAADNSKPSAMRWGFKAAAILKATKKRNYNDSYVLFLVFASCKVLISWLSSPTVCRPLSANLGSLISKWRFRLFVFMYCDNRSSLKMTHCGFSIHALAIEVKPDGKEIVLLSSSPNVYSHALSHKEVMTLSSKDYKMMAYYSFIIIVKSCFQFCA